MHEPLCRTSETATYNLIEYVHSPFAWSVPSAMVQPSSPAARP